MRRRISTACLLLAALTGCDDLTGTGSPRAEWKAAAGSSDGVVGDTALEISGFGEAVAVAGGTLTIEGRGFSPDPTANRVTVAGVEAAVLGVDGGTLKVRVPDRQRLPCTAGSPAAVAVSSRGRQAESALPLRSTERRELRPGEVVVLDDPSELACNQLADGARYLLAVVSTGRTLADRAGFRFASGEAGQETAAGLASRLPSPIAGAAGVPHLEALGASRALRARLGAPRSALSAPRAALAAGAEVVRRVPVKQDGSFGGCASYETIRARVVYAGRRAVVLEDVASPRAGRLDSLYVRLGTEYDDRMYPVLTGFFGDPAADRAGDPPTEILFSPAVDRYGASGFAWIGDHYPASSCAASNEAAVVYLAGPPSEAGTQWWATQLPGVAVHEAKHVVAYAERLARGGVMEESWLEEASAQAATEIWGRTHYDYAQLGDASPERLGCGLYWQPACGSRANPLYGIFTLLSQALAAPERHTPLGRVDADDYSLYGSAWLLLRYAADHSGKPEAEFFRALTQDGSRSGIGNLEARAGRSYAALVTGSALASALDDRAGLPVSPVYQHPSWNLPAIYQRILKKQPLPVHALDGPFDVAVPEIRSGGAWYAELTAGSDRPLSLTAVDGGGAAPEGLRLAIVRLQ